MEAEEIILQQVRDLALQVTDIGKNIAGLTVKLQQKDIQCQKDREDRDKMLDLLQTAFERVRCVETELKLLKKVSGSLAETEKELKELTKRIQIMETQDTTKEKVEEKQADTTKTHWTVLATMVGWGGVVIAWLWENFIKR